MGTISDAQWDRYKNVINNAHNYFNQDTVTWRRLSHNLHRYGEDPIATNKYTDIPLKCLILYNAFRTWPLSLETNSGVLDGQNMVMILNVKYLSDLGYLNGNGFFDMDPGNDIFIHKGLKYRSAGETPVSQAKDSPLHFYVVLKREETLTGEEKY